MPSVRCRHTPLVARASTRNKQLQLHSYDKTDTNAPRNTRQLHPYDEMCYIYIYIYNYFVLLILSSDALNSHRASADTANTHLHHSPIALACSIHLQLTRSAPLQTLPAALFNYSIQLQHSSPTAVTYSTLYSIYQLQRSPTALANSLHLYSTNQLQPSPTALINSTHLQH